MQKNLDDAFFGLCYFHLTEGMRQLFNILPPFWLESDQDSRTGEFKKLKKKTNSLVCRGVFTSGYEFDDSGAGYLIRDCHELQKVPNNQTYSSII